MMKNCGDTGCSLFDVVLTKMHSCKINYMLVYFKIILIIAFSALTPLVEWQEVHLACED